MHRTLPSLHGRNWVPHDRIWPTSVAAGRGKAHEAPQTCERLSQRSPAPQKKKKEREKKKRISFASNDERSQNVLLWSNVPLPGSDSTGRGPLVDNAQKSERVSAVSNGLRLYFLLFFGGAGGWFFFLSHNPRVDCLIKVSSKIQQPKNKLS